MNVVIRIYFNFSVAISYNFTLMFSIEFFTVLLSHTTFIEKMDKFSFNCY